MALTPRGQRNYIRLLMGHSLTSRILTAVAVGVMLLGHVSPVAAGMLLCVGDGTDPDCCGDRHDSRESRVDVPAQLLDRTDCGCCIAIDAALSAASASTHKASLDVLAGSARLRKVSVPTGTRIPGAPLGGSGETGLSSLRTVVLLI